MGETVPASNDVEKKTSPDGDGMTALANQALRHSVDEDSRYVHSDIIVGFGSYDPAVRDEHGNIEWHDC